MRTVGWSRLLLGVLLLTLSAAAAAQNAVTNDSVSVYAGPDDSYPMVARLDADSPVQVMGCLGDWSWCDVTFADNRGWVYAPDIEYDYEGGYVPFYTYAPSFGVPVVQFTINEYWDRYYRGRPWYAEREEWAHREPPHHHRPAGPPPTAGPPPRSARVDRPSHDARREPPLRLGNAEGSAAGNAAGDAERARREADRPSHDTRPRDAGDARPREVKPPEMKQPPDMRQRSPETRSALEHPPAHVEPPRHEERASPPHQAEGGRHEETHRTEKTGEPPKDTPH
jgi:uncharacterized protein YraI